MRICDLVMYKWWMNQSVLLRGPTLQVAVMDPTMYNISDKGHGKYVTEETFLPVMRSIILLSRSGS